MRKLFVLLLVALVPVMIGCRLVENDDTGPDVQPAPTATATSLSITPKVTLPPGAVSAALRDSIAWDQVVMTIDGKTATPSSRSIDASGAVTLVFGTFASVSLTDAADGSVQATINLGAAGILVVNVPVSTTVSTTGVASNSAVITVAESTTTPGSFTATIITYVPTGTSVTTTDAQDVASTTVTPATVKSTAFYVTSVLFVASNTELGLSSATANLVNTKTPSFKVTMNATASALASFSFTVTCLNSGISYTMLASDTYLTYTPHTATSTVVFDLLTNTNDANRNLETGKTYKVTFNGPIYRDGDTTATPTISGIDRYFYTKF